MPNTHGTLTELFTDIADAIREKDGSTGTKVADAFPDAIRAIPTGGGDGTDAFCKRIAIQAYASTSISKAFFTNCSAIEKSAFAYCYSLAEVSFPVCTDIASEAFRQCSALTNVSFPACTTIYSDTFQRCISLSKATFNNCTLIQRYAFRNCFNLVALLILASSVCALSSSQAFLSTPIGGYTGSTGGVLGSIFVPASLVSAYKAATNWTYFADRIAAIPEGA